MGGCWTPRSSRPRPGAMSPWCPGPNARGRWSASGGGHRQLWGRPDPLCACLRPPGGRGQPARPQPAAATRQVGSDRRPSRCPGDPGRGGHHRPQTGEGQVEMIRVLGVARRGALKARVAAAEQLHGVLSSAPDELRQPLLGRKTKALVATGAAMRPGPLTGQRPRPRPACGLWLAAGNSSRPSSPSSTANSRNWSPRSPPPWSPCPGLGSTPPASCWSLPATPPSGCAQRLPSPTWWHRSDPGVLGPHPPPPGESGR
jgi:hypothetical protein